MIVHQVEKAVALVSVVASSDFNLNYIAPKQLSTGNESTLHN